MTRTDWRVWVPTLLALGGVAWWLFGVSIHSNEVMTLVLHRRFGRVLRVDVLYATSRAQCRERLLYTWAEPFAFGDPLTSCAALAPEAWQDRNCDGHWDTWTRRIGPDAQGRCQVEFEVDTTADGEPDWRFLSAFADIDEAIERIEARRGF